MLFGFQCARERNIEVNKNNGKEKNYKLYSSFQKFINAHIIEENFSHGAKKWKLDLMVF